MPAVAPDLRPRGPAELYDAAVHLCTRGGTPLPALAITGAVFPAASGLVLAHHALTGKGFVGWAAVFALCLMIRGIFAGAAALSAEACLEGNDLPAWAALKKALSRGLSLASAAGVSTLIEWALVPGTLFIGLAIWSPLWAGPALVARGESGPWGMGRACRKRLAHEPTFAVRLLHGAAFLVVVLNLYMGIAMALYLGRALLALDVTFVDQFASVRNPIFLFFVAAMAMIVLAPVKSALGLLLLVDARVRSEGLDLLAAVERLSAARAAKGIAASLLIALAVALPSPARATESQAVQDLDDLMSQTGLSADEGAREDFEAAGELTGPDALALKHFADRLRDEREAGESTEVLKRRLREGLAEMRSASQAQGVEADPQQLAQAILAQPEFEPPAEHKKIDDEPEKEEPKQESLLARLLKWLLDWLFPKKKQVDPGGIGVPFGGVGAGVVQVITWVLIGLALALLAFVVGRALMRRREEQAEAEEGGLAGGAGAAGEEIESALAKAPRGWWSDADAMAARGDFRGALRAIYLAVLSALHRRGAIEYDPTRSNWDYVRAFRGGLEELPSFRDLTRRFDFAWYGRLGADAMGYDAAKELAGPLVAKGGADA